MKIFMLLSLLLLVVMPAILPAATFWDAAQGPVNQIVSVVLMLFGVPLLLKLGKKMGLTIDESLANDAIQALINILVNVDFGDKDLRGDKKKKIAVTIANNTLPNAQRDVLVKKYGSMEAAVQVAFERSSLNNKAGK